MSELCREITQVSRFQAAAGDPVKGSELCLIPGPSGEIAPSATTALDEPQHISRVKGQSSGFGAVIQGGFGNLAEPGISTVSSPHVSPGTVIAVNDRRFASRLGSSVTSRQDLGGLASGVPGLVHEPVGIAGNFSFPGVFLLHSSGEPSFNNDRQFNSYFMHQESGNFEVSPPVRPFEEVARILRRIFNNASSQAPAGEPECISRPGISSGSSFHRVVSRSHHLQEDLGQTRSIWLRSVRQQIQQADSEFCFSISGSVVSGYQCFVHSMGPVGVDLPLSSNSVAARSSSSAVILPREGSSHSTFVRGCSMVPQSPEPVQGPFPSSSFDGPLPGDTPRQGFSSEPFYLSASRVETISMGLRRKGFSRVVIERVVGACRDSTQKTYQSAWKTFLDYLSVQGIPHNSISVPVVCEFLDYFCTDV